MRLAKAVLIVCQYLLTPLPPCFLPTSSSPSDLLPTATRKFRAILV
jgi:hypothetical protein